MRISVEGFPKLKSVGKLCKLTSIICLFSCFDCDKTFTLGHALVGHVMETIIDVEEFECRLKCIGKKGCKSVNVHPDGNNEQRRICELNNETRLMKPGDFKWRKGSTYYGSIQVS